jgi:hypothetical protein
MIPSHDLSVRSGNGWTIVETAAIQQTPGAHDIGKPLGIADGTVVLVILRAAGRWAPNDETMTDGCAILRREGRMLVELSDATTRRRARLVYGRRPLPAERRQYRHRLGQSTRDRATRGRAGLSRSVSQGSCRDCFSCCERGPTGCCGR